jgi:hypothetical protein
MGGLGTLGEGVCGDGACGSACAAKEDVVYAVVSGSQSAGGLLYVRRGPASAVRTAQEVPEAPEAPEASRQE